MEQQAETEGCHVRLPLGTGGDEPLCFGKWCHSDASLLSEYQLIL